MALEGTTDHAEERTMRSEFMLVRGGGEEEMWLAFRDVLDVNGHATESQRGRLEQWLTQASGTFRERARALALEQARYNLGDIVRTINVPTLPLEFLLAERQARFRFKAAGEATMNGVKVLIISLEERECPHAAHSGLILSPAACSRVSSAPERKSATGSARRSG